MSKSKVRELVERFRDNQHEYTSTIYREAETQSEFIEPLFEALGWDVQNKRNAAEAYKPVIHQPRLKAEDRNVAPDYAFRVGQGTLKFYVEVKTPSASLDSDQRAVAQLRRYGWSSKLPISVLTNFREFSVYDCTIKPALGDSPREARIKYITYDDYENEWDWLVNTFSPDAIVRGWFDKYATATKRKGTLPVDADFLSLIEKWREDLSYHVHSKNPTVSAYELNLAIQRIIDRIVFIRIAEDKGFEPEQSLLNISKGLYVYSQLVDLWKTADRRYNSGLFYLTKEAGRDKHALDILTPNLKVGDITISDKIIATLYYPRSQHEFSVLPANILGQIYERYLGKTLYIDANNHLHIDFKPDIRKASGVYYTPTYIVRFIVNRVIDNQLRNRSLNEISNDFAIVDPACGSGSFLIEAYQHMLDWYLSQYSKRLIRTLVEGTGRYLLTIEDGIV